MLYKTILEENGGTFDGTIVLNDDNSLKEDKYIDPLAEEKQEDPFDDYYN